MPSLAKDIMKKLLSAWAFISAAFNHGQYKLILSSHAVPIWMLGHNKGGAIKERDRTVEGAHQQISRWDEPHTQIHPPRQRPTKSTSHCMSLSQTSYSLYVYIYFLTSYICVCSSASRSPVLLCQNLDVFIVTNSLFPSVTSSIKSLNTDTAAFIQYSNYTLHILRSMRRGWSTVKYELYIKLQKILRYDSSDETLPGNAPLPKTIMSSLHLKWIIDYKNC